MVRLLISPNGTLSLYGVKLDLVGEFIGRYLGSALLGVAVTYFMASRTDTTEGLLKAGLFGGFVLSVTGLIVAIWDGIAVPANGLVWINTAVYAFLSIGFGYFYFKK